MKKSLSFLLLLFCYTLVPGQNNNPNYDSTLAKSLGADDLGMKNYVLVILKTGSANITDKAVRDSLFKGHFKNINHLAEIGKLSVAGPLGKNDNAYRGIFIFNVSTLEDAKELLKGDPTITSNIFDVELYNWYGPAALPVYMETYEKTWKVKP